MLALILILAILFFGAGLVLKLIGITVGTILGSGVAVILLIIAAFVYLLTKEDHD